MPHPKTSTALSFIILCLLEISISLSPSWAASSSYTIRGTTMGTNYKIIYYAADPLIKRNNIDSILQEVNQSLSLYIDSSIISKVNQYDTLQKVDTHFKKVYQQAYTISKRTEGYFDFTIKPLVGAWGFGPKLRRQPKKANIDSLRELVNYRQVNLNCRHSQCWLHKDMPGIQIDFNAIAKGYGVDIIADHLEQKEIDRYLVEIGGEVISKGKGPDQKYWRAGIPRPVKESTSPHLFAAVQLHNQALATSGNYKNFYYQDSIKYVHSINPNTGQPELNRVLSASVITDKCIKSDAYSTAFMIMGFSKAKSFLHKHPKIEGLLIYSGKNGQLKHYMTQGIKEQVTIIE